MTEQVTLIPGGIDSRRQHDITTPDGEPSLTFKVDPNSYRFTRLDPALFDFTIQGGGRTLITIKPDGTMIVHDAQEACLLLQAEWNKMRGISS